MTDREPYDRDRDDADDRDHDDADPKTLEDALKALDRERRRTSKATKEAGDRRHNERVLKERIADLEGASSGGEWRGVAVKALIEATAREQGVRTPSLLVKLVDVDGLAGETMTEEEIRLRVIEAVSAVLEDAPELKRPSGQRVGALSPGVRQRLERGEAGREGGDSDWLRKAARHSSR